MSRSEPEANKRAAKRLFTALQDADTEVIRELIADGLVDHSPMFGRNAFERDNLIEAATTFRAAFPDVRINTMHIVAEGDRVVVHEIVTGTNTGAFHGLAATGRRMRVQAIHVLRFDGGRVAEHWSTRELDSMIAALPGGLGAR